MSSLFITFNSGDTWAERLFTGATAEEVTDISFSTQGVGLLISNTAGLVGSIHHTIDGGYTWEEIAAPVNSGFNAVVMIDTLTGYVVGEVNGGTAMIVQIGV
jgi:photosystem II stability/assembly factor-like uncharacterized protein